MIKNKLPFFSYLVLASFFAAWSWILTAPNLVLSSWSPYWTFQTWLWRSLYSQRLIIVLIYTLLIIGFFLTWFLFSRSHLSSSPKTLFFQLTIICLPFLFSFNALSFDVFNYLFNAKMVISYGANPHTQVALDFASDPWVRFMHNTHTSAPYGYGWTGLSLLPYLAFGGKFLPTWLSFRFLNFGLLLLTFVVLVHFQKKVFGRARQFQLAWFFFNPLVLIELLVNMHNDLWMMLPALGSLFLIYPVSKKTLPFRLVIFSILLLLFSLSIKFATLALLPAWLFLLVLPHQKKLLSLKIFTTIQNRFKKTKKLFLSIFNFGQIYFFDFCALLMFLPLLTPRSQFFHPWYLIWSLIFLPLVKWKFTTHCFLVLSFSSLLRYLPYLWLNGFDRYTLLFQQLITFLPLVFYTLFYFFSHRNKGHV